MSDAPGPDQAGPQTKPPEPPRTTRTTPLPATEPGGRRALLLGIAGVVTSPFVLVGAVLSLAAVITGVRARGRGRRVLAPAPGAVAGIVLGLIGLVLSAWLIVFDFVAGKEMRDYVQCRQSALTIDDQQTCQHTYFPLIERRLHVPKGTLDRHRSWL